LVCIPSMGCIVPQTARLNNKVAWPNVTCVIRIGPLVGLHRFTER
jgi:hypothetical protein